MITAVTTAKEEKVHMSHNRDKLNTAVERAIHDHVKRVKEATIDFVQLYVRRNNINLDRPTMARVLEIVEKGIDSEHLNKLDMFMQELDTRLAEFSREEP